MWCTYSTPWHGVCEHSINVAAAKLLQSCPTLCKPIDSSPPGSPIPGVLQARTLEWVAISFSNAWKWKVKVKPLSRVWLLATPWTAAYQAPLSMGFSRQEYWSGVPLLAPIKFLLESLDLVGKYHFHPFFLTHTHTHTHTQRKRNLLTGIIYFQTLELIWIFGKWAGSEGRALITESNALQWVYWRCVCSLFLLRVDT